MTEEKKPQQQKKQAQQHVPAVEPDINEQMQNRIDKMKQMVERGIAPFGHKYLWTHHAKDVDAQADKLEADGTEVKVCGRLMAIRGHGKACFADMMDKTGRLQLYLRKDVLGDEPYATVKLLDIGDIVGAAGTVFKTHSGEISVRVNKLDVLSKSLRPLPEKWHGLKDVELRYRQRYVDLIVNPEVKETFVKRSRIIKAVREILDGKDFLEVETPILNTIPGGAAARPFITYHNALDMQLYLRIATELNLKRLVVGGLERVYEMGRIFRNEGIDIKHNPEFTSVEIYQAYADYTDMMELTETIVSQCAQEVLGTMKIQYEGVDIDLTPPWPRLTMIEAVKKYSGKDFANVAVGDVETARKMATEAGVEFEAGWGVGKIINAFFDKFVEEKLIQPIFITEYPKEISPLAKSSQADPNITDRFEGFIYAREICNGFTELNDPIDQRERFLKQVEERNAGDEEANMMDEDFIHALEYGLPPTGGLGIGIDRLVMFLTNASSIRDVLFFPHMRPLPNKNQEAEEKAEAEKTTK
jgi:lysyl-tRNA synthetase class 2